MGYGRFEKVLSTCDRESGQLSAISLWKRGADAAVAQEAEKLRAESWELVTRHESWAKKP
jgi:hypothetical protein